jgi:hypothetical protein
MSPHSPLCGDKFLIVTTIVSNGSLLGYIKMQQVVEKLFVVTFKCGKWRQSWTTLIRMNKNFFKTDLFILKMFFICNIVVIISLITTFTKVFKIRLGQKLRT